MRNLPQSVIHRLPGSLPAAEPHPDPDLLTAFAERSLSERERSPVVDHLARCGDCRDIVALAAAAGHETELQALPSVGLASTRPWFAWPALRWSALAAGILIVASVGILQYGHHRQSVTVALNQSSNETTASAPASSSPAATRAVTEKESQVAASNAPKARISVQNRPGISAARIGGQSASAPMSHDEFSSAPAARSLAAGIPNPFAEKNPPSTMVQVTPSQASQPSDIRSQSEVVEVQAAAAAVNVQSTAAALPQNQIAQNQIAQNQMAQNQAELPLNGRNVTDLDVVKAKSPVPSQLAAATAAPRSDAAAQLSPPPASRALRRWAINSGTLQRSGDEGKTWENVNPAPGSPLELLAISVNGLEVWVGGSPSTLLHTTDSGDHWTRVTPSSAGAALTGNVVGIQFSDPQHGKITTSTSETWITSDAGQTWAKQQ